MTVQNIFAIGQGRSWVAAKTSYQPDKGCCSDFEIEAGFGMVIAMDPELTEELKQEWIARDLVRAIQDARKEAEFNVEDRIHISISWDNISDVLEIFGKYIETETLSTISNNLDTSDLEKEVEIGELKVVIQLKK